MWNNAEHISQGFLIALRKYSFLLDNVGQSVARLPFSPLLFSVFLYPSFCSFCLVGRGGTQCCGEPNFIVEAGRIELPSEIKPRRTSTCLVRWIVLIPISASYTKYRNQLMRSHSVDMSTLLNQPVKMTPLSKTTGKFYSGRLTSVKRKQLGRNWHLLCFPGD